MPLRTHRCRECQLLRVWIDGAICEECAENMRANDASMTFISAEAAVETLMAIGKSKLCSAEARRSIMLYVIGGDEEEESYIYAVIDTAIKPSKVKPT